VDGVDVNVSVECSKTECLGQFDQTWAENRMAKLNEMDGAVGKNATFGAVYT